MSITVLFAAGPAQWDVYRAPLAGALADAGIAAALTDTAAPEAVDYIVTAPGGPLQDYTPYTRCKAVLNLWAGVEGLVDNPTLTQPLARMVDPGLTRGMVEYVTGHVLRYHLGIDAHLGATRWAPVTPPLAQDRCVGVLGLGALGGACAQTLVQLGFEVAGWARAPKRLDGVRTRHGPDGLAEVLARAQILVTLLPHTPDTDSLLGAARLAQLPAGAWLINPGRGALVDDAALLDALDRGQLAGATLDVFRAEPLPPDHPFWIHPKVTVTPHVAATTRPESAACVIAANIAGVEGGAPLAHRVDRARGY